MTRLLAIALTSVLLLPHLADAQTVVIDPQLLAVAKQSLAIQQQQLAVLDKIEAIEQAQLTRATADAALAYALEQGRLRKLDQNTK